MKRATMGVIGAEPVGAGPAGVPAALNTGMPGVAGMGRTWPSMAGVAGAMPSEKRAPEPGS